MNGPEIAVSAEERARRQGAKDALGEPQLLREGWPFEFVDKARFDRLRPLQRGRVEQALLNILDSIEVRKDCPRRPADVRLVWSATGAGHVASRQPRASQLHLVWPAPASRQTIGGAA